MRPTSPLQPVIKAFARAQIRGKVNQVVINACMRRSGLINAMVADGIACITYVVKKLGTYSVTPHNQWLRGAKKFSQSYFPAEANKSRRLSISQRPIRKRRERNAREAVEIPSSCRLKI